MNTTTKHAYVNDLIALCDLVNDYEEFNQKLNNLISSTNTDVVKKLSLMSQGKKILNPRIKKFYSENKKVFETINKYSNINKFLCLNYDLKFFHQYIYQNIEKINNIKEVLYKIKELGFEKLELNETSDFTKAKYIFNDDFEKNFHIIYVDNIEVLPTYNNVTKYKTTNSDYQILLKPETNDFHEYGRIITLNNLVFDKNRLPKSITKEIIFDYILNLKNSKKTKFMSIKNSVSLDVTIEDLKKQLIDTLSIVNQLDIKNKEQIITILTDIEKSIKNLQELSLEYTKNITDEFTNLTSEILEEEKKLYLKRRENYKRK